MLPGLVGRSKTTTGPCGRRESSRRATPSSGISTTATSSAPSSRPLSRACSSGDEQHPLGVGRRPQVVGPGGGGAVGAQQGAHGPALLDGPGDRPDALHQELTVAVALGAVGQQRLPLLEARVLPGDPQLCCVSARRRRARSAGSPRRRRRASWSAACAPSRRGGRRRRCRACGRSRAAGSGRAVRRPRSVTGAPSRPWPSTRAQSGRAQGSKDPGKDRQPSSSSSRRRSLPSGRVSTGLHTTPTVRTPLSSGQSKTNIATSSPTWQAARPTPSAAYIVATMSAASAARCVVVRRHGRPGGGA